jgi:hypothetical protein
MLHFKERGQDSMHCLYIIFMIPIFFSKTNYVKQLSQGRDNWTSSWMGQLYSCDLRLWGGKCHIFPRPRRGKIWCGFVLVTIGLVI